MKYEYRYHDNCVFRRAVGELQIELYRIDEWVPWSDVSDWFDGTSYTEEEAKARLLSLGFDDPVMV